jgi:hypothetical protein
MQRWCGRRMWGRVDELGDQVDMLHKWESSRWTSYYMYQENLKENVEW